MISTFGFSYKLEERFPPEFAILEKKDEILTSRLSFKFEMNQTDKKNWPQTKFGKKNWVQKKIVQKLF